jgi:adenine-specific DNA methylase
VASRAAVLASLLPASADHEQFKQVLGIHGDPVGAKRRIEQAKRTGENLGLNPYGYERAFRHLPTKAEREWMGKLIGSATVLDPTAGGGSIPFEALRLGQTSYGNDLNPVAALLLRTTIEYPGRFGRKLLKEYDSLCVEFLARAKTKLSGIYPPEPDNSQVTGYLWARTIRCPYCEGVVPLSPNWKLAPDGTGVRLMPRYGVGVAASERRCDFAIVQSATEQSQGTIADGDATCPFPDCHRIIDGEEVKRQAQSGQMGDQLFAVVFKKIIQKVGKNGKARESTEKTYRSPRPEDDNLAAIQTRLAEKLPEWEALDYIPNDPIPDGNKTSEPRRYGMFLWKDMFSPRQLFCHGTSVEIWRELLKETSKDPSTLEVKRAALLYLAISIDKFLNWNARLASWNVQLQGMRSVFDRHDFAFKWSYAEMPASHVGLGYEWVLGQTKKCLNEILELIYPEDVLAHDKGELDFRDSPWSLSQASTTCKSGDSLDHLANASVDAVVMDPPYYDNVMYAELSDFFYVWLKRTAGQILPELFRRPLTDKENEAVANAAKFKDQKGAKKLAGRDYQERMASIFAECRRVLKPTGILTIMFTHKATGAWDALTKGLMHAGFTITASWPINTEAEGSLHIKDKAAANSTIFLACRPRAILPKDAETQYWEDVEPLVAGAVRKRVAEFQAAGIRGVDLYLACFGPALEEFSKHWPLKRGTPNPLPPSMKRAQKDLFPEEWDPYAVSPEDALNAARREVKSWRLEQLTHKRARTELDPRTSWFVLAWDAFQAPVFPYDEALRLARAVGVDLEKDIVGSLADKKGSDLTMWDSVQRANKGALGSADGSSGMIDALHHAAYQGRTKTLESARELLERAGIMQNPNFRSAMQAILEVLPVGTAFSGVELPPDVAGAGNDFEAIEKLRRLAFADQVESPQQLVLWQATTT